MRIAPLLAALVLFASCTKAATPAPVSFLPGDTAPVTRAEDVTIDAPVVDLAGVVDASLEAELSQQLRDHQRATGVQMAVLTVASTGDVSIEEFSLKVATAWGGGDKATDTGLLFVLAVADRKMRLEVGYGLEPALPDGRAGAILGKLKDPLRAHRYGDAVATAVERSVFYTDHLEPGVPATLRDRSFGEHTVWAYTLALLLGLVSGHLLVWSRRSVRPSRPSGRASRKKRSSTVSPEARPLTKKQIFGRWMWLGALLVVGALTIRRGYSLPYLVVCAAGIGAGVLAMRLGPRYPASLVMGYILFGFSWFIGAIVAPSISHPEPLIFDAAGVIKTLAIHLGAGASFSGFFIVLAKLGLKPPEGGGGYGGSSGGGSSSSSSSSSSYSSSSSSSSSGYSGGGGSFGGGGASSSW